MLGYLGEEGRGRNKKGRDIDNLPGEYVEEGGESRGATQLNYEIGDQNYVKHLMSSVINDVIMTLLIVIMTSLLRTR